MKKFKLYQMSFDGSYVLDSEHNTIEEAEETSANLGSKWYFYPLSVIVTGQTVKETGGSIYNTKTEESFLSNLLKGKRLQTVSKLLNKVSKLPEAQNLDYIDFEDLLISILFKKEAKQ